MVDKLKCVYTVVKLDKIIKRGKNNMYGYHNGTRIAAMSDRLNTI